MTQEPSVIVNFSSLSTREIEGAGPTTFKITAWDDGSVVLEWSVGTRILATIDFCINAFFALLMGITKIFGQIGQPLFFGSCDKPTVLACFHDETFPEIGLGVLNDGEKTPISIVMLDRGTVLTAFDQIGHQLAALEDVCGCEGGQQQEEDEEDNDDEKSSDDPFSGINTSILH